MVLLSKPGIDFPAPTALITNPNTFPSSIAFTALYSWTNGAIGGNAIDNTDIKILPNAPGFSLF